MREVPDPTAADREDIVPDRDRILDAVRQMAIDPSRTELVSVIYRTSLANPKVQAALEATLTGRPRFVSLWEKNYHTPLVSREELLEMPAGSLGRGVGDLLLKEDLEVEFLDTPPATDAVSYYFRRAHRLHDLLHVLTGFDTSVLGELQLQAFHIGQFGNPTSVYFISAGLMYTAENNPERVAPLFRGITQAYEVGRHARLIIVHKLEERLEEQVSDVREELGIVGIEAPGS